MGSLTTLNVLLCVCLCTKVNSYLFTTSPRFMDTERFAFDMEMWRFAWLSLSAFYWEAVPYFLVIVPPMRINAKFIRNSRIQLFR